MPPNLNILNMSDNDKLSLGCKTVHEETKDQKLDSSDETVVKTLDNNVIEKSSVPDVEKVSNVKLNLELEQENSCSLRSLFATSVFVISTFKVDECSSIFEYCGGKEFASLVCRIWR
jgi:hypothetical protein